MTTACVGSLGWARWADLLRLLIGLPTPAVTPHILRAVEESSGPAWRTDIKTAYELFATKHVESLTSRQILEAAFEAMRTRAGSSAATPRFSDVANVVPDDQARFDKATDELLRERPDVAPEDLRSAAIDAMVNLVPDGHTRYWPIWADAPIRDIAEGRCEVRSELLPGGIGYIWWNAWVQSETIDIVAEVRKRMDSLLREGARAWLFDVRGNHGGAGARPAAAMFLNGEPVFRVTYRDGREEMMMAERSLRLPDEYQLPIAIAVDSGTWSASEIFAFGLQQYSRATIVGERTAGFVGSVDGAVLSEDARVAVNVTKITGPNGEMYNNVGVKPDIETKSADAVEAASRYLRGKLAPVLT
jgi:hypothetical protein